MPRTARLEDTEIRAPFSGRVGLRRVSVGTLISPGDVITTLDDTSVIKLDFAVPENFLASLREGLSIRAQRAAYPGRSFAGTVASIDSRVDIGHARGDGARAGGQRRWRAQARHVPQRARSPMTSARRWSFPKRRSCPSRSGSSCTWSQTARCREREVRIGGREPGIVEITAGLAAGEHVVVEGTQKLRDGASVRAPSAPCDVLPEAAGQSHEASATSARASPQ